jgi:hypothetical protein
MRSIFESTAVRRTAFAKAYLLESAPATRGSSFVHDDSRRTDMIPNWQFAIAARRTFRSLLAALLLCACAESDDSDDPKDSAGGSEATDELLAPPPSDRGVQFAMLTEIAPGLEAEHCQFVQAPPEDLLVQRDEIRFSSGSHHALLYETDYEEIPTEKEDGTVVDTSGVFDCSSGATDGWRITKLIAGSQNGTGEAFLSYPPGVALRVRGSAVLLMNTHYVNPGAVALHPEVRVNLHTLPPDEVEEEGDLLFLYNNFIAVGAGTTSRARMRCPINRDITLVNAQSHMHRRGVGFSAAIEGEAPFYENERWEDVPVEHFPRGLKIAAGSRFDYQCDYQNDESRDIYQGPRSTDEMCMLIGAYYPADRATSACLDPAGMPASEWVGNGEASCAATLECVSAAKSDASLTRCMLQADPNVAAYTSNALHCALHSMDAERECAGELAACLEH